MIRVLHIIPYRNLYPPQNGGALRCFHILQQLSKIAEVDVISYQPVNELKQATKTLGEVNFYSPESVLDKSLFNFLPPKLASALNYRWYSKTIKGPATYSFIKFRHIIDHLHYHNKYDYVVIEHLSTLSLSTYIRQRWSQVKIVYDAHNVDHKLIKVNRELRSTLMYREQNIHKYADYIWACSNDDNEELARLNKRKVKVITIPNGVDNDKEYQRDKVDCHTKLIFCGTLNYPPNVAGLQWFSKLVWPTIVDRIPEVQLTIIGKGYESGLDSLIEHKNVRFVGKVDSVIPFYNDAFVSIVPLLEGSGTRLKVLEAMSLGNPIVGTEIGLEGICIDNGTHALIENNPERFANAIINLINNPDKGNVLRKNARQLIDSCYTWDIIGEDIKKFILNE